MFSYYPERPVIKIDENDRRKSTQTEMGDYRHDREKYRLFCGFMHIKTATWIILALGVISLIWQLFRSNYDETKFGHFTFMHSIDFAEVIMMTFALTMLLCGLIAERQSFLIPYLVVQVFKVVGYLIFIVTYVWDKFFNDETEKKDFFSQKNKKNFTMTASEEVEEHEVEEWIHQNPGWFFGTVLAINCLFLVIGIIAIYVVVKCRKYFTDLQGHLQQQPSVYASTTNPYATYR